MGLGGPPREFRFEGKGDRLVANRTLSVYFHYLPEAVNRPGVRRFGWALSRTGDRDQTGPDTPVLEWTAPSHDVSLAEPRSGKPSSRPSVVVLTPREQKPVVLLVREAIRRLVVDSATVLE